MDDILELQAIMLDMARRLDADSNDREARAIFDRSAELLVTLCNEEFEATRDRN